MKTKIILIRLHDPRNAYSLNIKIDEMDIDINIETTQSSLTTANIPNNLIKGEIKEMQHNHLCDFIESLYDSPLTKLIYRLLLDAIIKFLSTKWGLL